MMEVLIVIAIIGLALVGLMQVFQYSLRISRLVQEKSQANALAQEMIEQARNYRDGTDWSNTGDHVGLGVATTNQAFHFEKSTSSSAKWELVKGEEATGNFTRKIVFQKVSRDDDDDIEENYNSLNNDPDSREIIATVTWMHKGKEKQLEIITLLTNWQP